MTDDTTRRFDAIDRDLLSINRRFDVIDDRLKAVDARFDVLDARLTLLIELTSATRREMTERFDVLLGAVADIGAKLTKHIEEGH